MWNLKKLINVSLFSKFHRKSAKQAYILTDTWRPGQCCLVFHCIISDKKVNNVLLNLNHVWNYVLISMHIEPPCFARTWASEFYMFRFHSCLNCRYLQISLIGTSGISGSYVELRAWREVCRSEPWNHQWAKETCRSERVHLFPFFFSVATMEITTISNSCALEVTPDDPVFVAVIRLCFWMFRYSSPGHVRGSFKPVGSVHFLPCVWLLFNPCQL